MRVDCLKMKILQLKNIGSCGQRFGFKTPHLPYPGPLCAMLKKEVIATIKLNPLNLLIL